MSERMSEERLAKLKAVAVEYGHENYDLIDALEEAHRARAEETRMRADLELAKEAPDNAVQVRAALKSLVNMTWPSTFEPQTRKNFERVSVAMDLLTSALAPLPAPKVEALICRACRDTGFDGNGTGYGNVCDECGGQSAQPNPKDEVER